MLKIIDIHGYHAIMWTECEMFLSFPVPHMNLKYDLYSLELQVRLARTRQNIVHNYVPHVFTNILTLSSEFLVLQYRVIRPFLITNTCNLLMFYKIYE